MVTSTSTPGSILMEVICLTISDGLCKSMCHLWILIWNRSQVLEPSPQGIFLVVILSLGRHPNWSFHFDILFLCTSDQVSTHLLQRFYIWLVRVILIQWVVTSDSTGVFLVSLKAIAEAWLPDWLVPQREWTVVSCSCNCDFLKKIKIKIIFLFSFHIH